jgi:hypothetical protein
VAGAVTAVIEAALSVPALRVNVAAVTFNVSGTADVTGLVNVSGTTTVAVGKSLTAGSHSGGNLTVHGSAGYTTSVNLTGTATVGNGTVAATLATSELTADTLAIHNNAKVTTAINGTADEVTKVNNLNFDGTLDAPLGQWDTRMGKIIIEGEVENTIRKLVLAGMTSGPTGYWDGNGIMSSDAANDTGDALHAVGFIDNRYIDPNDPENPIQLFTEWGGQQVSMTSILFMYTYFGDADMNETVDGNDYTLIDNGFNAQLTGWINGDFDYSGTVDGGDYTLIDNSYNALNS